MGWDNLDWDALERLRESFLSGTGGRSDYWRSAGDLAAYDLTFAQRIGWKWRYVLNELSRLGWSAPAGDVLDWGCGSGIAGRVFMRAFASACDSTPKQTTLGGGTEQCASDKPLVLWDRSTLAMEYAAARAQELLPGVSVRRASASSAACGTLLVSHVLTELSPAQVDDLVACAAGAAAVVWVEPGTHDASRALIGVRERLRGQFQMVAPCTHQAVCGMLAPANQRHWCHHFADTPPDVFTDGNWARFARAAGIDLRSLPVSYLVLDRRPAPALPQGARRVIGRPRVQKAFALLFGCDASGVSDYRLSKRRFPAEFRDARKERLDSLQVWQCQGDEIVGTDRGCQ